MSIRIPVHRPHLGPEELEAMERVFASRWLGAGQVVVDFQDRVRELTGAKHVLMVNSGTAALHVALEALGLQPGDEVIVPSLTFISSAQAVVSAGGRPVFCEVRADTLTIDVEHAARCLTERTRAIMPVHYGGRICDMEGLRGIVEGRDVLLVEDAAHAFGSVANGRWAGTLGEVGCYSFDPIKNVTCGGGGAVLTDEDELASTIAHRSNVGIDTDSWSRLDGQRPWFYTVAESGHRYRMSNINAAIGLVQLGRMDEYRARKLSIVRAYDAAFRDQPGVATLCHDPGGTFPFNYVVRVLDGRRDALLQHLSSLGIGGTVQFIPCHLQPRFLNGGPALEVTERLYDELLTLPLYFEMSDSDVGEVIAGVTSFLRRAA